MVELGNGVIRLLFDPETGNLHQITEAATGRKFLGDPRGNRLLNLIVPTAEHLSRPVPSHTSGRPTISANGERLTLAFDNLRAEGRPTGIRATVEVRLPAASREAFFSTEVENRSPDVIDEVHCPWVGGWTGIAGKGVDELNISHQRRVDPHTFFPTHRNHTFGRKNMPRTP